eukprot:12267941-Alexandrium_andersonii.AAC.1
MSLTFGAREDLVANELKAVFAKQFEAATRARRDSRELELDSNPSKKAKFRKNAFAELDDEFREILPALLKKILGRE